MQALISNTAGGPKSLRLGTLPEPVAGPGELLVEVATCGLNYPDLLVINDRYQLKPPRPFAPGIEIAGTVAYAGEGVDGFAKGDRIVATTRGSGGLAERAIVRANRAFQLAADHDFVPAAAFLVTYSTAIHALVDRGRLLPGEKLLVMGAAGGVGLAAVQIGRLIGAEVIAAVSSEQKAELARHAGAHATILYPARLDDPDCQRAFKEELKRVTCPDGVNVVFDPVGGPYAEPALRACVWGGRYLVIGFAAGIPTIPLNLPLLKGLSVIGVFQGEFAERSPGDNARNVAQLFDWWAEGLLDPPVNRVFPLAQAGEALEVLASRRALGKLVVDLRGGLEG